MVKAICNLKTAKTGFYKGETLMHGIEGLNNVHAIYNLKKQKKDSHMAQTSCNFRASRKGSDKVDNMQSKTAERLIPQDITHKQFKK